MAEETTAEVVDIAEKKAAPKPLKTLLVDIDYLAGKKVDPAAERKSNQDITRDYCTHVVNSVYEKGLDRRNTKIWGAIQDKLDDAVDNDLKTIELEKAEVDFMRESWRDAKFPPLFAKFFVKLEAEVQKLTD